MSKFMGKIPNSDSFGGLYSHISATIKVKFGTGGLLPRAKVHFYRSNVSPLQGKNQFWTFAPLGKRNTGRHAAMRACLPVTNKKNITLFRLQQARDLHHTSHTEGKCL